MLKVCKSVFILTILVAFTSSLENDDCQSNGACLESVMIDQFGVENPQGCENFCKNISECAWFTYYADQGLCTALTECKRLDNIFPRAVSGQSNCGGQPLCKAQGRCTGVLMNVAKADTSEACLEICQNS